MSTSSEFWQRVFTDGSIVLEGPPHGVADRDSLALLERFHEEYRLEIAGPPLPFVAEAAAQGARIVEMAAWYLASQAGTPRDLERHLVLADEPAGPADHLSADLTLRYLPCIHQRARVLYPADPLPALLGEILRRWPLSGMLADLPDAPLGDLDFGGHPGLLFLYAERLAENLNPAWIPRGLGAPYVDLVWAELGRDPALLVGRGQACEVHEP